MPVDRPPFVFASQPLSALRPLALALALAAGLAPAAPYAHAEGAQQAVSFDIPPGPLAPALRSLASTAGAPLTFTADQTAGRSTAGLRGSYTTEEAFAALLSGTGLEIVRLDNGGYVLRAEGEPETQLRTVEVRETATGDNDLPATFAGGQVARGGRMGVLGNRDFMEVPVSLVTFTSEFRDNTQALSVSDMLKYSVSAQTPQAGATPTTDVIYVRGFNVGTYDGTFDGLPGLLGRMPPVEAVERVELILGANTFANGQPASTGGNINIVPKRAGAEPLLRVGANYRTDSLIGTTVDASTRFGAADQFGVRANLAYTDGDTEYEDGERRVLTRALSFDFQGDKTRFNFDYMGNDRRLPAETWFVINPGVEVPDDDDADRDFRQPWTYYKDGWDTAVMRGEWEFVEDWTLSAAYGHMWNDVERFSQVSEITDDDGNMQDAWGGSLAHSRQKREGYAGEIQIHGRFDTGPLQHRPRLGFSEYGEKGGYAAAYGDGSFLFPSNIYDPVDYPKPALDTPRWPSGFDSRTRNRGLFLNDEIAAFDERLLVTVGVRRVQFKSESRSEGHWDGDRAKEKWSPAYGVVFKATPWMSLYANRLEALEAGYEVQPPADNAGEVLPPLPADQIEAGAKFDFGRLGATVAVFDIDKPSYLFNPVTRLEGSNGRQVNRGIELALFGEGIDGLRLYSSATYIDPKMKKTPEGAFDGEYAVSAARFLANAYLDWDVPGVQGLALLGGVSHNGSVYNDEANTQKLDAWTRFDAGLRYRTEAFGKSTTVRLTIDNLLDESYFVSERGTIYLAPERTVGVAFTVDL